MTTKRHITNALTAFALFSTVYLTGLLVWWQFYPYQTASVEVPIEVQNKDDIIPKDEPIHLVIVATKSTNLRADISTGIICSNGDYYGATATQGGRRLPEGTFIRNRFFLMDKDVPADETCFFRFNLDYKVNPIRTIHKVWDSEPFEVRE